MHILRLKTSLIFLFFSLTGCDFDTSSARQAHIRIVGSTSVYTYATFVAEYFGKTTAFQTPIVEATGSGGGLNLFCRGAGLEHPDIVNSSRRISISERKICRKNGVKNIIEVPIGYDGIVLGAHHSKTPLSLTRQELFLALAEKIPFKGQWIPNPHKKWQDINPNFPAKKIMVLGPTSTLATREVFEKLVILEGCKRYTKGSKKCRKTLREDGVFIEAAEHENVIIQRIEMNPDAYGIFSFGFLDQNRNKVQALPIEKITPTAKNIATHIYPISRPLFFYVKGENIPLVKGMKAYVSEFLSAQASGKEGYLTDKGLIPLPEKKRKRVRKHVLKAFE
ncbi:MAG: substrate-binding domain-containing protein [Gammaproteobacteria bacterium]|nr:substrate-binding domain-containing protein [Gammaproteobacteria bacterium]